MKSAEELFGKWGQYEQVVGRFHGSEVKIMSRGKFLQALSEHDKEIISLIDGIIGELRDNKHKRNYLDSKDERRAQIRALIELKQKLSPLTK